MRRSAQVFAPLLAATAVALSTGCHRQPEPQRCVDEQNHVVDPKFCANLPEVNGEPEQWFASARRSFFGCERDAHVWSSGSQHSGSGLMVTP